MEPTKRHFQPQDVIHDRFTIIDMLGQGSFGQVYKASDSKFGVDCAIKIEEQKALSQLNTEAYVLQACQEERGFPAIYSYGQDESFRFLAMELLGPSLSKKLELCRQFQIMTTANLLNQIFRRVQALHKHEIMHRDIKPENICLGAGRRDKRVFLIDFGLSKFFIDPRTSQHIEMLNGKKLTGTARYTSLNSHNGLEQSRRDDLCSVCYVMAIFLNGRLPWQGVYGNNKEERYQNIIKLKSEITPVQLFVGRPPQFAQIYEYVLALEFEQEPDYKFIRGLLKSVAAVFGSKISSNFDWQVCNETDQYGTSHGITSHRDSGLDMKRRGLGSHSFFDSMLLNLSAAGMSSRGAPLQRQETLYNGQTPQISVNLQHYLDHRDDEDVQSDSKTTLKTSCKRTCALF